MRRKKYLYVSERITNISELEKILEGERLNIEMLKKEARKEAPSMEIMNSAIEKLAVQHQKAINFEFCLERRKSYN